MAKLFVKGNAIGQEGGIDKPEIEEKFAQFGPITDVWVGRSPSGFAFVTFENVADRDEAVEKMDGTEMSGCVMTVEVARENRRRENIKPGDWSCQSCRVNNFARREECFRCGASKPRGYDRYNEDRGDGRRFRGGRSRSRERYHGGGGGGRPRSPDRYQRGPPDHYRRGGGGGYDRRPDYRDEEFRRGGGDYPRRDDGFRRDDYRAPPPPQQQRGRSRSR